MSGRFQVEINPAYCKACRLCIQVCPKNVLVQGADGKAVAENPDDCIGCQLCEYHCPDFAITIRGEKKNG